MKPARRPRWLFASPFVFFTIAGLVGMLAIGGGGLVASQRAGRAEAMADVRALTQVVAKTVVEPNLTAELIAGDEGNIAVLDAIVTERVIDDTTVRVKLWDASGKIVYSDEPLLIGEVYELEADKHRSLWSGETVSEISDLQGPENRFEAQMSSEMMEVYLPIEGPDGGPLLYESYFAMSSVSDSASRIRSEFLPIIVVPVVLMGGLHFALVWGLRQRVRRAQAERERLLRRAVESSDLERRRIAADLHDGVVQDLVGTSFAVSAAAESAAVHAPELSSDLRSAAVGTRRSLQSLRSLLVDIYPPNLHEQGLEAALVDLLAPARDLGIETELTIDGELEAAPEKTALLYRVIQESVRNVFRHANADHLNVHLATNPDGTTVEIMDDGAGFVSPHRENGHLGLRLLADLTADAGAGFTVESEPGVGTTIRLELTS
ncbi:MAG: sensor histidine kinase [Acidimicrobiales bacterium]